MGWDKFVLVGMSMGCLNGMHFAARHAERLHAFVAIDAGPWVQSAAVGNITSFVENARKKKGFDDYLEAAIQFNPRRDRALLEDSLRHGLQAHGRWFL